MASGKKVKRFRKLKIVGVMFLMLVVAGATYIFWPDEAMHPVYSQALEQAKAHAAVQENLGTDIAGSTPDVAVVSDSSAEFQFMIDGEGGVATVTAKGAKVEGQWETTALKVEFLDGTEHDLLR